MFSDTDHGAGSSALRIVTCDLLTISECVCCQSTAPPSDTPGSSSKRKVRSKPQLDPEPADSVRAKCLLLLRPTVIDRLILESKTALEEMEGRRSVGKQLVAPLAGNKPKTVGNPKEVGKRKRAESLSNGTSPAVKRLRNSKGGSESDSSPSRNASSERKSSRTADKIVKAPSAVENKPAEKRMVSKNNVEDKNGPSPKKLKKSEKSRFSKRIRFPSSSLRSGKKRMELLKIKRIVKNLSKDSRDKTRRPTSDKTDSNSNVCTENDSNDETVDNSTDSEVSRSPDFSDIKDKDKGPDDDLKKRKKRRKRDSMWVKKVKKQLKTKPDSDKSLPPPAFGPFIEDARHVIDELPVLDDSCSLDFLGGDPSLSITAQDDVPMPMLEKEVEITVTPEPRSTNFSLKIRDGSSEKEIKTDNIKNSNCVIKVNRHNEPSSSTNVLSSDAEILKSEIKSSEFPSFINGTQSILAPSEECKENESIPSEKFKSTESCPSMKDKQHNPSVDTPPELHLSTNGEQDEIAPSGTNVEQCVVGSNQERNVSKTHSLEISCEAVISSPLKMNEITEISSEKSNEVGVNTCEQNTQTEQVAYKKNDQHSLSFSGEIVHDNKNLLDNDEPKIVSNVEIHPQKNLTPMLQEATLSLPFKSEPLIVSDSKIEINILQLPRVDTDTARNRCTLTDSSNNVTNAVRDVKEDVCGNLHEVISESKSSDNCESSVQVPAPKVMDRLEETRKNLAGDETALLQSIKASVTNDSSINLVSSDLAQLNETQSNDHNKENMVCSQPNMVKEECSDFTKDNFVSSAQILEEEITKLEAVLCESPEQTSNIREVTDTDHDMNCPEPKNKEEILKTDSIQDSLCESTDIKMALDTESKSISLLDADSTSDAKPQSLDDSFGDFSLSLPEDLDSVSVPSDEERDEETEILPDSTECEHQDEPSEEVQPPNEVTTHIEPQFEEMVSNLVDNEHPSKELLDEVLPSENKTDMEIDNLTESEIDISECRILKQEFPEEKPLAGSTPRRPSTEDNKEEKVISEIKTEVLTVEQRQMKESVLQALGLKSLNGSPSQPLVEEKPKRDGYTGTLKAVIKLNRSGDKKKMVYQRSEDTVGELEYRICSEIPATDGVPITHLNDIAGIRKNVSKLHHEIDNNIGTATSNGHSNDHDSSSYDESKNASGKDLIIPEKSSSFSIHPGRLCSDVCTYCFGKFGCLDTPCHVAALKPERQKKILENEQHLTAESCLCDACYRYVDRKANCPSKSPSGGVSKPRVKPPASTRCCVNGCQEQATHTVKKKWLIKLKRSITNKLDIDLEKPGAMYVPLCAQHHYWVDYFTVCGICRKRLNRNHLFSLGSETDRLNLMLAEDGIPARLSDKLFLCKLCRYYSNLRLKYSDPGSIPHSGQIFYRDYRRKILTSLDLPVSDSEDEPPLKDDKKKSTNTKKISADANANSNGASASSKSDESVMSLSNLATLLGDQPEQQARIQVKFGNVNIGRLSNLNIGQGGREERLPYSDVGLQASLEFERSTVPDESWERCVANIQFDKRTKILWQDLQRPYGNQSSFLRHLVMLEKYWRAGHLVLAPNTDERVAKYLNGVKNRIKSFEGSGCDVKQPPTIPVAINPTPSVSSSNSDKFPLITNTGEIEVTPISLVQKRSTPTPIAQIDKKPMTPLDRAKSLVRMVPPTPRQHIPMPIQRYQMPVYVSQYAPRHYPPATAPHQRPPPLLKIRNKVVTPPPPYYQQIHQAPILTAQPLKPILPKLPSALTVTHVPQGGAAITLNRSGITIEKQTGSAHVTPTLPIEKPSISVFREPAPGPP